MERIIQPYDGGHPVAVPARPQQAAHLDLIAPAPAKSGSDYFRALRRRAWLVLACTVIVGGAGSAWVLRMAPVYRAAGLIQIEPPAPDPAVAVILNSTSLGNVDRDTQERYIPNRLARTQNKALAQEVLREASLGPAPGFAGDPAMELTAFLSTRRLMPGTSQYEIALEGSDPARVGKLLNAWIKRFDERLHDEALERVDKSKGFAGESVAALLKDLTKLDNDILQFLNDKPLFAPGGKFLLAEEYASLKAYSDSKRAGLESLIQESRIAAYYPKMPAGRPETPRSRKTAKLSEMLEYYEARLYEARRLARSSRDPSVRQIQERMRDIVDMMSQLDADPEQMLPDRSQVVMNQARREVDRLDTQVGGLRQKMHASMPDYQKYLSMLKERERKEEAIASLEHTRQRFEMVSRTQPAPVTILQEATEPTSPVRPQRGMLIGVFVALGLMLGLGLVCLGEFLDRSVKVPEHLTAGLTLPLLGVVPRMRRLARTHRGGHLWTPGNPASLEADAYRNLRASLLSAEGAEGPIVTLLVTSAKAGEGKSTTSLNLAAICARSGERTLLIDVDLRRPSLGGVFDVGESPLGLVDVLKGDIPWQRAVVRTDLPNLNFLPAGDPTGVPIEILGSLELRQLLKAVAGQYHRVILDGPAVLGLADCRMLGRAADAAILVVRSGAHELRPLRRAKQMLEQSRVTLAGVVFNDLSDDLHNWSSYGPGAPDGYAPLEGAGFAPDTEPLGIGH